MISVTLNKDAHAIRVVRAVGDSLRMYTPLTGKDDPFRFCYVSLNQALILHRQPVTNGYAVVDVLNRDGDIIQDIVITRNQYRALKMRLKFEWENRDES